VEADLTHRAHAVIEQVFADLISGPLAHLPSGRFGANGAWLLYAAMAHNLTRAAGTLTGRAGARARGGTLRRQIANIAARLAHHPADQRRHLVLVHRASSHSTTDCSSARAIRSPVGGARRRAAVGGVRAG